MPLTSSTTATSRLHVTYIQRSLSKRPRSTIKRPIIPLLAISCQSETNYASLIIVVFLLASSTPFIYVASDSIHVRECIHRPLAAALRGLRDCVARKPI